MLGSAFPVASFWKRCWWYIEAWPLPKGMSNLKSVTMALFRKRVVHDIVKHVLEIVLILEWVPNPIKSPRKRTAEKDLHPVETQDRGPREDGGRDEPPAKERQGPPGVGRGEEGVTPRDVRGGLALPAPLTLTSDFWPRGLGGSRFPLV